MTANISQSNLPILVRDMFDTLLLFRFCFGFTWSACRCQWSIWIWYDVVMVGWLLRYAKTDDTSDAAMTSAPTNIDESLDLEYFTRDTESHSPNPSVSPSTVGSQQRAIIANASQHRFRQHGCSFFHWFFQEEFDIFAGVLFHPLK